MAFQRVPNTVEIDVIYLQNVETVQNTFYARFAGTYSQANLAALAAAVDAYIASAWLPLQTLDCDYLRTEVKGLNAENDFFASDGSSTGPGTDVSEALPNNVTLAIKKTSGLSGRSARGRNYWIGTPVGKLTANENFIDAVYTVAVVDAIDDLRGVINGEFNWQAVLVSRFAGGVKRDEGETFDWIGTSSVNSIVDSQRGRLPS